MIGNILKPVKKKIIGIFNINTQVFSYKLMQTIINFLLVCFAWIFFRANTFTDSIGIIKSLFKFNPWVLFDGTMLSLGLGGKEFCIAIISILIIVTVDYLRRKMRIREYISNQNLIFRWMLYIGVVTFIVIFGSYGPGYSAQQFIYFQF